MPTRPCWISRSRSSFSPSFHSSWTCLGGVIVPAICPPPARTDRGRNGALRGRRGQGHRVISFRGRWETATCGGAPVEMPESSRRRGQVSQPVLHAASGRSRSVLAAGLERRDHIHHGGEERVGPELRGEAE